MISAKKIATLNSTSELLMSFFIYIALILSAGWILNLHQVSLPPIEDLKPLFMSIYIKHLAPKPQERFIFLSVILLLPILSILAIKIGQFISGHFNNTKFINMKITVLSVPFLIILYFYNSEVITNLIFLSTKSPITNYFLIFLSAGLLLFLIYGKKIFSNKHEKNIVSLIAIAAIIFQTLSSRIMSIYSVDNTWAWAGHFEAFFYSISQVVAGKTVLADLPTQYGLYPELLKPIFSLIGLSIFKVTLIMGILQILSLLCLFFILQRFVKSSLLLLICILSLCIVTGFTWRTANYHHWDPYFAYYPLRFLFPCLVLFLLSRFAQHKNITNLVILSLACGVANIWNLDVGIPTLGTAILYLGTFLIFPRKDLNRANAIKFLLLAIAIIATTLLLFFFYLNLKTTVPLKLTELFKYQKLFYLTGFAMLPIPKNFDIWQIIMCSYLFGFISFIYSRIKNFSSPEWDLIFWLSILGIGTFIYYEGRSHFHSLILVSWPAVLLAFLFIDKIFRLIKLNMLPKTSAIITIPILLFGVFTASDYLLGVPFLYNFGMTNWSRTWHQSPTLITENINFIKANLHGEKEAGIWLPHQGAYFAEIGAASAIKGPGLVELVLIEDANNMIQQIAAGNPKILFVTLHNNQLPLDLESFLKDYTLVDAKNGIGCLRKTNTN